MMTNPSIFRRAYDLAALLALLHMLALVAVGAYLVGSGTMSLERLRGVVAVLRGEGPSDAGSAQEMPADTVEPDSSDAAGAEGIDSRDQLEILRLEAERIKAVLDQRLALNNSIMLRVTTERQAFQQERAEAAKREQAAQAQRNEEGYRKQIAIYEGLAPKIAVQHLLALNDPDKAARILLEMEARKAKKIVEVAKRGDQLRRMQRILERVRVVAPERSSELDRSEG